MTAQEQPHEHKLNRRWVNRCRKCGRRIWFDRDHIADGNGYFHAACYYALCVSSQHGDGRATGADNEH